MQTAASVIFRLFFIIILTLPLYEAPQGCAGGAPGGGIVRRGFLQLCL